jgi:hypothetical protein
LFATVVYCDKNSMLNRESAATVCWQAGCCLGKVIGEKETGKITAQAGDRQVLVGSWVFAFEAIVHPLNGTIKTKCTL